MASLDQGGWSIEVGAGTGVGATLIRLVIVKVGCDEKRGRNNEV